jgi:hypothetical protein
MDDNAQNTLRSVLVASIAAASASGSANIAAADELAAPEELSCQAVMRLAHILHSTLE